MDENVNPTLRLYPIEKLTSIANAIRAKLESSDTYTIDEMVAAIASIPMGSDLLAMMQNNDMNHRIDLVDSAVKSDATNIRSYAFYYAWFNRIDLSKIESVGEYAFYCANGSYTGGRTQIKLPACKTIGTYAFKDFSRSFDAINELDLSSVESVASYAFNRAKIACKIVLPKCVSVGSNSFQETQAGPYGLEAPFLETIGNSAFNSSYFTPDIVLPKVKTIGNNAFHHTSSVNFTIGPDCTSIGNTIFAAYGVTNLYVLATTPPTLGSNFKSGNTGADHIYVPAESVDLYKAANVWSNYASIIEAIPTA